MISWGLKGEVISSWTEADAPQPHDCQPSWQPSQPIFSGEEPIQHVENYTGDRILGEVQNKNTMVVLRRVISNIPKVSVPRYEARTVALGAARDRSVVGLSHS